MQTVVPIDSSLREMTSHSSYGFPIKYYLDQTQHYAHQTVNRHWHDELELATVWKGVVDYWIGDEKVRLYPGEGVFINTRVIHGYTAEQQALIPNLVFSPEMISAGNHMVYQKFVWPILRSQTAFVKLRSDVLWQKTILELLEKAYHLINSEEATKELDLNIMLSSIGRNIYLHNNACNQISKSTNAIMTQSRLRLMLEFIYEN
ncbi:cupin domain-containing protein [Paenibacillus xylanexedens]|uniref:cupin domain-containing protein n=1 Tax=Paenibacillus xylanexedens TaxID=528191 RepID=UPI00119FCED9|nr:AraC family ligand binding domain-containing protein [Paenibacillus xylanexedens]